jgi:hypothetical protein
MLVQRRAAALRAADVHVLRHVRRQAGNLSEPDVWVAKHDGSDIIRAAEIVGVGRDYNGNITARLSGGDQMAVTLVLDPGHDHAHTPDDFHRQLVKVIAGLSGTAEAAIVRPAHDVEHGWRWIIEKL